MQKNRAVIYARFSSHNQRSESIEIQVDNSRAFCEREGLQVVEEYCDYAQTGRNTDREQFQRMMTDAALGKFDFVVIYKVTRIMRNRDEMAYARIILRRCGVEILYAGEDISSGSSGVLQLGMLEVLAEWESAVDSERIKDGINKNAERCLASGQRLYGWDVVDDHFVINEHQAGILRKMKNMLIAGNTISEISRSFPGETGGRGAPFNPSRVRKLLKRPQNAGVYKFAGHEQIDGMPAIWSASEQELIDTILDNENRPRKNVGDGKSYPLSGRITCTTCGAVMRGTSGTSKTGKTYRYYRCPKCHRSIRKELIEDLVYDMTLKAVGEKSARERIASAMRASGELEAKTENETTRIKNEIKRIDDSFSRIWDAIEEGFAPPGGKDRIEQLKRRKAELELRLKEEKQNEAQPLTMEAILDWLDHAAEEMTEDIALGTFVNCVEVDRAEGKIYVYYAFDKHGNGFSPSLATEKEKSEHLRDVRCSPSYPVVELKPKPKNTGRVTAPEVFLHKVAIKASKDWFVAISTY